MERPRSSGRVRYFGDRKVKHAKRTVLSGQHSWMRCARNVMLLHANEVLPLARYLICDSEN